MISPEYATTHYFYPARELSSKVFPHTVNLYLDYNCPFSAKIFFKLKDSVIPELNKSHPGQFQFVFVNVIQPWHPNSNLLHEFSLEFASLLRKSESSESNKLFWDFSEIIFKNKEQFYDTANVNLNRNEIYKQISTLPDLQTLNLPFEISQVVENLKITPTTSGEEPHNSWNAATNDVKYFTKYLRGVGVHVTPTVSVDGVTNNSVSSGDKESTLVETFIASI